MATSYIPGKALSASFGGTDLSIKKSNFKVMVNKLKVTNKKSNGYQELVAGIKSASGTMTFAVDSLSPVVVVEGSAITVVVGVTGGRTFTGSMMVGEISDEADIDGDYTLTVSLDSTGSYTAA